MEKLMQVDKVPIITIDGPSGTGKGTISLLLAQKLGWNYLDSGAIYRILSYAAQKSEIDLTNEKTLVELALSLKIRFDIASDQTTLVYLDNEDITQAIRSEACGQSASMIASKPAVRAALLERQRQFAIAPGLVTDGRDMGTVVFPNADLKIYLFASSKERAKRRFLQLQEKGSNVSLAQVIEELEKRDQRDFSRVHAPLRPAKNAVEIDTTSMNAVQVYNNVLQLVEQHNVQQS